MLSPTADPDIQRSVYAHYWDLGSSYADAMSKEETESLQNKKGKSKGSQKGKKNPKAEKQRFYVKPPGRRPWEGKNPWQDRTRAEPKARPQPSSSN